MNFRKQVAGMIGAAVLVTGIGTGIAFAADGGSSNTPTVASAATTTAPSTTHKQIDCSKVPALNNIAKELKANALNRADILKQLESVVTGHPKAEARLAKRIARIEKGAPKLEAKLAALNARCATPAA
jgi:hypothetical protein